MSRRYAQDTQVSVAKSRAELEELLQRHGATATAVYMSGSEAAVAFEMADRRVRFRLRLPDPRDEAFTRKKANQHDRFGRPCSESEARERHEKACRRLWRALVLAVKAKLVAVDDGVETFEEAFMAHVVMPDGKTVAEHVQPRIADAYHNGESVPLLPGA
jgi:hypothetical protein